MEINIELIKIIISVIGIILSYFVVPFLKAKTENIKASTTEKQRADAIFWGKLAVNMAETIYREKGQGLLKKADVIKALNNKGIQLSEADMELLIKGIVDEFNKHDWKIDLLAETKVGE